MAKRGLGIYGGLNKEERNALLAEHGDVITAVLATMTEEGRNAATQAR